MREHSKFHCKHLKIISIKGSEYCEYCLKPIVAHQLLLFSQCEQRDGFTVMVCEEPVVGGDINWELTGYSPSCSQIDEWLEKKGKYYENSPVVCNRKRNS